MPVVYFNQLLGAVHPIAGRNMHFLHANAIFTLFCMFSHQFTPNKKLKKALKNAIQANAGSHPKAGLTPCEIS